MGLTMWLQQKLNPAPADPMQAKIFGVLGALGQWANDKKFQAWKNSAIDRGILKENIFQPVKQGDKAVYEYKLLKKRGLDNAEFGGGGLIDIAAETKI